MPIDEDKPSTILSFFNDSVLLPPPGEPVGIDDIRQPGIWGREEWDRPGDTTMKLAQATKNVLQEIGITGGRLGLIGDNLSTSFCASLGKVLPEVSFQNERKVIEKMQRIKSRNEQALMRAASQLSDIGTQAVYHACKPGVTDYELYAAFTFAQMSRGGESGDGYQIGMNQYGTHYGKPYGHVVKKGDVIILYVSGVTYRGYTAQCSRMFIVGEISQKQEEVISMCVDAVKAGMSASRPGALVRDVNNRAFQPFIERGYVKSPEARELPYNWEPNSDGSPRRIPVEPVEDSDWEEIGRSLRHVYPATIGGNQPNMGHEMGMPKMKRFSIQSNNYMKLEPGMIYVIHAQWLEPKLAGCNVGNLLLIREDGAENLSAHSSLEPYRIRA